MPYQIDKFKLPANAKYENAKFGDEPALDHILKAADQAGVPKANVRDNSDTDHIDVSVVLETESQKAIFKVACDIPRTRTLHG